MRSLFSRRKDEKVICVDKIIESYTNRCEDIRDCSKTINTFLIDECRIIYPDKQRIEALLRQRQDFTYVNVDMGYHPHVTITTGTTQEYAGFKN